MGRGSPLTWEQGKGGAMGGDLRVFHWVLLDIAEVGASIHMDLGQECRESTTAHGCPGGAAGAVEETTSSETVPALGSGCDSSRWCEVFGL